MKQTNYIDCEEYTYYYDGIPVTFTITIDGKIIRCETDSKNVLESLTNVPYVIVEHDETIIEMLISEGFHELPSDEVSPHLFIGRDAVERARYLNNFLDADAPVNLTVREALTMTKLAEEQKIYLSCIGAGKCIDKMRAAVVDATNSNRHN